MPALQHIYVTMHGSFNTGSWLGESAQIGVRLAIAETGAMPDKGTVFNLLTHGDVTVDSGITAGTNGTLTRTWTARRGPTGSNENCDEGFQIDLAEDAYAFLNAIKAYQHSSFRWTHVKMAPIDATGATVGTSSLYTFTTPINGGGLALLPPQVAFGITARANILGRRGRGRIYLPAVAAAVVGSDGVVSTSAATNVRTAFKAFIDAMQNLPGTPDYVPLYVIMSPGLTSGVRPAEIRTGNRTDTIRSRREQVPEVYTTLAL